MQRRLRLAGLAGLVSSLLTAPLAAQQLELVFEPGLLRVTGLPPAGSVALVGVVRRWEDMLATVYRYHEVLVDDDGDGAVELEIEIDDSPNAIWVVADLATGKWLASAPPLGELHDGTALAPAVESRNGGSLRRLRMEAKSLDLLFVRPGQGAWYSILSDGASGDADEARDGRLRLDPASLRRMTGAADLPQGLASTDLVVAIDPDTLRVVARRASQLPVEEVQ